MNKFLETCNLPKLNHKQIKNLNRMIISNKIKSINKPPPKKNPSPDSFIGELYKIIARWWALPSSFYDDRKLLNGIRHLQMIYPLSSRFLKDINNS